MLPEAQFREIVGVLQSSAWRRVTAVPNVTPGHSQPARDKRRHPPRWRDCGIQGIRDNLIVRDGEFIHDCQSLGNAPLGPSHALSPAGVQISLACGFDEIGELSPQNRTFDLTRGISFAPERLSDFRES